MSHQFSLQIPATCHTCGCIYCSVLPADSPLTFRSPFCSHRGKKHMHSICVPACNSARPTFCKEHTREPASKHTSSPRPCEIPSSYQRPTDVSAGARHAGGVWRIGCRETAAFIERHTTSSQYRGEAALRMWQCGVWQRCSCAITAHRSHVSLHRECPSVSMDPLHEQPHLLVCRHTLPVPCEECSLLFILFCVCLIA